MEHIARHEFAIWFCVERRVADIDRESLCGNRLIDLEQESWNDRFDVIVSLETIGRLASPWLFPENARRTAGLLIISTPIGEFKGYNSHHKQVLRFPEFRFVLERYFQCNYYSHRETETHTDATRPIKVVNAIGTPRASESEVGRN